MEACMHVPHGNNVPTSLQTPIGDPPVIGSSCEDMLIDQPQVPYNEDLWDGNTTAISLFSKKIHLFKVPVTLIAPW